MESDTGTRLPESGALTPDDSLPNVGGFTGAFHPLPHQLSEEVKPTGEMKWLRQGIGGELALYIKSHPQSCFIHYTASRHYQPDVDNIHSKGWATYQHLLKLGYKLLSTPQED